LSYLVKHVFDKDLNVFGAGPWKVSIRPQQYIDVNLFLQVSKHGHALILNYCQNKIGLKHANLNLSKALGWIKNMGFYVIED
jgi:hypothetical protein